MIPMKSMLLILLRVILWLYIDASFDENFCYKVRNKLLVQCLYYLVDFNYNDMQSKKLRDEIKCVLYDE